MNTPFPRLTTVTLPAIDTPVPAGPVPTGASADLAGPPAGRAARRRPVHLAVRLAITVAAALAAVLPAMPAAQAGQSCEEKPPLMSSLARGLSLAHGVSQALDRSGSKVVVLARAGQDLSRHGLRWSHIGLAYQAPASQQAADAAQPAGEPSAAARGPTTSRAPTTWRVVHKLNDCGEATSGLYRQGLAQFFNDDPFRYEAALLPLKPDAAARLLPILLDNDRAAQMHEPRYSLVSYPWSQRYQQSNQWAIETLAYALEPGATTRRRAQAWLMLKDYRPTTLNLHALERLGARMTRVNVNFDDHPGDKRWNDLIETVGADSVLAWLARNDLSQPLVVIR